MFRFDSGDNSLALLKRLFLWYKTLMWKRRLPPSDSCDEVLIWSRSGKLSPTRAHTLVSSRCFQDVERVCRAAAAFCCFRFLHVCGFPPSVLYIRHLSQVYVLFHSFSFFFQSVT